jgi:hypothetical protein
LFVLETATAETVYGVFGKRFETTTFDGLFVGEVVWYVWKY